MQLVPEDAVVGRVEGEGGGAEGAALRVEAAKERRATEGVAQEEPGSAEAERVKQSAKRGGAGV
jgi:hypothetical protein